MSNILLVGCQHERVKLQQAPESVHDDGRDWPKDGIEDYTLLLRASGDGLHSGYATSPLPVYSTGTFVDGGALCVAGADRACDLSVA